MQTNENFRQRRSVGALLGQGFRLYGRTLNTGFTATLLCSVLPSLVISVILYLCLFALLRPVFVLIQTILQSALSSGLDEQAIGRAVQEIWDSLNMPTAETIMASSLGVLAVTLLLTPVQLAFSILLQPLGLGAVTEAQSRAWHGVRLSLSQALAAAKGKWGRLIVLNLVMMLATFGLAMVVSLLVMVAALLPMVGPVAVLVVYAVEILGAAVISGVFMLMLLIAVNEDRWHFNALVEAGKRFFTDWRYILAFLVFFAISLGCGLLCAVADIAAMLLLLFPPVLTVLAGAFILPLGQAFMTAVYYEQRREGGYAQPCAVEK